MQWFWILPSLGYGVYLFATTGQAYGLIFGGLSLVSMVGGQFVQRRNNPVDIQKPVWFGATRVAIGNRILPKREWLWKPEWTDRVYAEFESEVAATNSKATIAAKVSGSLVASNANPDGLSAWLGFESSKPVELDLASEGFHALVVGPTGSGKSQFLTTWLVSLCQQYDSDRLQLALVDYKGGACLGAFASEPQTVAFATDLNQNAPQLFEWLASELERRSQQLALAGVGRNIDLGPNDRSANLLVVIDEAQPVLLNHANAVVVENIASRGRSLGVHLIITGQSLSGISRNIIGNLGARILVGKPDPIELAQLGMGRSDGSKSEAAGEWATATLATNSRQITFRFATFGKVSAQRLQGHESVDLEAFSAPTGTIASESVVNPKNVFEFDMST